MKHMLSENLSIAISAALDSGKAIMDIYLEGNVGVEYKNDLSPITDADIVSSRIINKHLSVTSIPIVSEETDDISFDERKTWKELWIVDPIDDTKEFISRNGEFTVNIAMLRNQALVLGVVYAPALRELYFAEANIGSFKYIVDEHISPTNLLEFSTQLPSTKNHDSYKIVASRSHLSHETENYIHIIQSKKTNVELISKGSSLKFCMVAEGVADCYPRFAPTMEWDTAAGHAICKFAGKRVTDLVTNDELVYNGKTLKNNWFIVD